MRIKFEPRDIWVGLYWHTKEHYPANPPFTAPSRQIVIRFYLCLIPCFPIIWDVTLHKTDRRYFAQLDAHRGWQKEGHL